MLISLFRYHLLGYAPRSTFAAGGVVRSGYVRSASYLSFLLLLYPISWGCSEGGNVISPTHEMIFYGVLDLLAGPVFLFMFLWHLNTVDYGSFGLWSGKYTGTGYGAGAGPGAGYAGGPGAGVGPGAGYAGGAPAMAGNGVAATGAGNGVGGAGAGVAPGAGRV